MRALPLFSGGVGFGSMFDFKANPLRRAVIRPVQPLADHVSVDRIRPVIYNFTGIVRKIFQGSFVCLHAT